MYDHVCIDFYCIVPSSRLRVDARLCVVSRNNIIKIKVPVRFIRRSGVKDDRIKMLIVRKKLTVIAKNVKKRTLAFMALGD